MSRPRFFLILHEFGMALGLHFGVSGLTFWRLFFESKKNRIVVFRVLLGGGHLGPRTEKGRTQGVSLGLVTFTTCWVLLQLGSVRSAFIDARLPYFAI